jgi:hypothetical protein
VLNEFLDATRYGARRTEEPKNQTLSRFAFTASAIKKAGLALAIRLF